MKDEKMMFCKAALSNSMRDGQMPLYAVSKFVRHFRGSPDASGIARMAAGRLAGLGKHRLSAIYYMHGGDNASAAAQLRNGGMHYPAIYNFLQAGDEDAAFELAEGIARKNGTRVADLLDTMSSRTDEVNALLSREQYVEAMPTLLSFMLVREATSCAEMLESEKPYKALDAFLMTGMLSAALEVFFRTAGTALETKGAADPRTQMLELMSFSVQNLSESCIRRNLHMESFAFRMLGFDFLTMMGAEVEVLPDSDPGNLLTEGRAALQKYDFDLALEAGKRMEELGLYFSAAELYGEMEQLPLQAMNLALAGEFERASVHRLNMERKATAREA